MPAERLQKIIAAAGIASRRKAEELITGGLVSVNGQIVTELGTKADPETDHIKVAGKALRGPERHVYLLLHKPKGYVTTVTDPEGRPTVMSLVKGVNARIYPVGRLDYLSEGLLLLTNDGELAQKLTHASSHVAKTYLVKVAGKPTEEELKKLRAGVFLPAETKPMKGREGQEQRRRSHAVRTGPVRIELLRESANPWYEITLIEGRNRQIRRMFEQIEHHVEKIKRVRYGPLQLDVEVGQFRHLTTQEVAQLRSAADGSKPAIRVERQSTAPGPKHPARNQRERPGGRQDRDRARWRDDHDKRRRRDDGDRPRGRDNRGASGVRDDRNRPRTNDDRGYQRGRDDDRQKSHGQDEPSKTWGYGDRSTSRTRDDQNRSRAGDRRARPGRGGDQDRPFGRDDRSKAWGHDDRGRPPIHDERNTSRVRNDRGQRKHGSKVSKPKGRGSRGH